MSSYLARSTPPPPYPLPAHQTTLPLLYNASSPTLVSWAVFWGSGCYFCLNKVFTKTLLFLTNWKGGDGVGDLYVGGPCDREFQAV